MHKAGASFCRFSLRRSLAQWQQTPLYRPYRAFHGSASLAAVKPFILADIGEGIKEVQIIQWFVKPGARVEQFDKICEVQSDKASVDITSRFDGVIKKLHYDADDMAQVGKPLCDIDIQGDINPADEKLLAPQPDESGKSNDDQQSQKQTEKPPSKESAQESHTPQSSPPRKSKPREDTGSLATPAVRGLLKELNVNIEDVRGTGKDGRVLKEDVHKFAAERDQAATSSQSRQQQPQRPQPPPPPRPAIDDGPQQESKVSLTPIQSAMFKSMTKSLSIPHFLYADEVDLTPLSTLRKALNCLQTNNSSSNLPKLSYLPFIIKAVSIALHDFPLLNARLDAAAAAPTNNNNNNGNGSSTTTTTNPPQLFHRTKHNIGVAMDTPQGLLVPNIKNVASLSVYDIAQQLLWLHAQAQASKLTKAELSGGTITVSNIGSIGGTYATPLIVQGEMAILAVGKARDVPAFATAGDGSKEEGIVVRKTVGSFSWSADHRVVDGATMARMGERVRALVEQPGLMAASLR